MIGAGVGVLAKANARQYRAPFAQALRWPSASVRSGYGWWLAKCARGACLMHDCSQMPAVRTSLPIAPSAWTCVRWRLRTKTSHCMSCPADVGRNVGSCALSLCRKKAGRELGLAIQRARMAKEWKQKDLAQVRYGGCLVDSPLHHCSQALSCSVQPLP